MAGYQVCVDKEIARRDAAITALKNSFKDAGDGIKAEVDDIGEKMSLQHQLSNHPWITMVVALGAGFVASRVVTKFFVSPAVPTVNFETQRVVVEVKHSGDSATVQAVEAPKKSPMDYLSHAVTAFKAVQGIMQDIQNAQATKPVMEEPVPIDEPQETSVYAPA